MTRSQTHIIANTFQAERRWSDERLLEICLSYIANQQSDDAFSDFLQQTVDQETQAATPGTAAGPRILATLIRQTWVNEEAVETGRTQFDVTDQILLMPLEKIQALKDHSCGTDDLAIRSDDIYHDGPYEVEVEEAICQAFEVTKLSDITPKMMSTLRFLTSDA